MSIPQTILDIAEVCVQQEANYAVLSPGSRNAPLALAFSRHNNIETLIIPDERSAGYIALGIAQSLKKPVILLSTSGTAALNYGPAIAEAFYQNVPLIVFTSDRPPEWIDQNDGQTIRQRGIFQHHTKKSFELPVSFEHPDKQWHAIRIVNEAINIASRDSFGPVHINAPFREPFYPEPEQAWKYNQQVATVKIEGSKNLLRAEQWSALKNDWDNSSRVLVVGGQLEFSTKLTASLNDIQNQLGIPVIGDAVSNLHQVQRLIRHPELILGQDNDILKVLQPDLLITFGGAIISKNLKLFLRDSKPALHWHVQPAGYPADTFKSISRVIHMEPYEFFEQLSKNTVKKKPGWYDTWQKLEADAIGKFLKFMKDQEFNELQAVGKVLDIAKGMHLHLANSTPVRWVDYFGVGPETIEISANRGASGIDGCSSTAIGHSLINKRQNLLISGDMGFFYDRNAFWHPYNVTNLKIVLINNHGGGIFRLIDGPRKQPELEELFVTRQPLLARNTAHDFGMNYLYCDNAKDLESTLKTLLLVENRVGILEIDVPDNMGSIYQTLKASLKKI